MGFLDFLFKKGPSAKDLLAQGAQVIDVRTPEEFKEGHGKGAVNIPLPVLSSKIAQINHYNKPIVLVCRSGARAGMAKRMLKGKLDHPVANAGAWQNA